METATATYLTSGCPVKIEGAPTTSKTIKQNSSEGRGGGTKLPANRNSIIVRGNHLCFCGKYNASPYLPTLDPYLQLNEQ